MRRLLVIGALGAGLALAACAPTKPPAPSAPVRVHQWYTYVYNETAATQFFETDCVDRDGNAATWTGTLAADQFEYYNWTYGVRQDPDTGAVISTGPVMPRPETCVTTFAGAGPFVYENFTPEDATMPWELAGPSSTPVSCEFPSVTGGSPGPYGSENVYWQCATKVTSAP
jgi:hypothetical protein